MSLYTSLETSIALREAGAPQGLLGAVYWCPESPDYPTIHHHCCAVLHEHRNGMCGPGHRRRMARRDAGGEVMGTNYYWIDTPCPNPCTHCQQVGVHIGKSSAGWCFSLHVDDECRTLADWDVRFRRFGSVIQDEYGRTITRDQMIDVITARGRDRALPDTPDDGYKSWAEFHRLNDSQPGPNGLVRARVDGKHCIGHGEGTWDYITGWFS